MADETGVKRLFSGLKRMFSSEVIVRNVGGKKLKIADTDKLQYSSKLKDKYNRMHTLYSDFASQYNNIGFQTHRIELFSDYDMMESDPIIASALDIYSDECTTRSEFGDVLKISSSDSNIKGILENLFYDILNIEFNLWSWTRNMCKYGDFYLHLEIEPEYGIHNVKPISTYEMTRIEDMDPTNPSYVMFKQEGQARSDYENYEIAHFRMLGDSNFLPYGKSVIEPARRVWKQLQLMEDAMLIHRVMRAPEKRMFYIDIGNIPPNEVDNFMQKVINKMKKVPFVDERTGDYNLKFNLQNMTEDFFMPVRGGDSGTRIENLGAMTYDGTEDIEYVKNKMMAALKIPKAFLGYEEGITGKATLAAEDIRFARTIERVQRIMVSELTKIAIVHLYAQGYKDSKLVDFNLGLTNPSTIFEEERVRILGEKLNTARDMMDAKMFSKTWIYNTIFGLSEDEVAGIRENFVDDAKEYYRLETIQNEGTDPADPNAQVDDEEGDESWGFGDFEGMTEEEKEKAIAQRKKEEKKRQNARKVYNHPDNKPMGRDPLGSGERRVSGRDWGDSPLKLEADFNKLDEFLSSKKSKVSLPTESSLIVENTEEVVKNKKNDDFEKKSSEKINKEEGYLSEDNLIDK
tara:strand:- start:5143 stop:7035 length:1893 start_codon:yes stop_codon:yes gene_type:complete